MSFTWNAAADGGREKDRAALRQLNEQLQALQHRRMTAKLQPAATREGAEELYSLHYPLLEIIPDAHDQ